VAELQHSAAAAGTGERILVFDGTSTPAPYAAAEIMLLPTHSENFGLVIAEAMANAVPVVVTATTPWSEIGKAGLGWWVPWDEFPAAVASATSRSAAALRLQGEAAQAWVSNRYSWQQTARQLEGFYHRLLHVR
jgi:glycosyltransferase involved in cell wall biosynthesis